MSIARKVFMVGLLTAAVGLALTAPDALAAAHSPVGHQSRIVTEKTSFSAKAPLRFTARRNGNAADNVTVNCPGVINGTVYSTYTDGVLTETETPWTASVICTFSEFNINNRHMSDGSELTINNRTEKVADLFECSSPPDSTCTEAISNADDFCFPVGGATCDGTYLLNHVFTVLLPEGFTWNGVSPGCTLLDPAEMQCNITSNPVFVPPTM